MRTRVLIPTGAIGLGFDADALARAVAAKPDIICVDGGSTDSGPFYLGTGTSKYGRDATRAEWRALMLARAEAGVPLVVGTAGTCGTDSTVDWMAEITRELAAELGQTVKIAKLYSSQDAATVTDAWSAGEVHPLEPVIPADAGAPATLTNIVALAGVEQITAALDTGADIVIAGRTTDTATIAALPLKRGAHPGGAWHGAKIGECGALCSTNPTSGVILIDFDEDGFTVQPMAEGAKATPALVSAHMLYENSDPFILYEPGGHLDVRGARYSALTEREVRVEGSEWVPSDNYTVKLEGARLSGYQSTILVTLRERRYVQNAQAWVDRLGTFLHGEIASRMGLGPDDYALDFRLIGQNATLGALENRAGTPVEVGVLAIVTAPTQQRAAEIAKLANPFLLHYPLTDDEPQATFAFPFSPADSARGALYEFALNHVMTLDDPMQAFRLEVEEVAHA
ncbi:acyclic terpene utilization AtuA family protein [Oceanibium sediminis]|uniref:acyclic terpene utilization AtuA family protein n=1 Tax=Oceanibium sediminis TaxID=2026339 RepID=UPI000DD3B894|nr:acyclic terpene utilization AtuA family protein [Oceanibium sediminis]